MPASTLVREKVAQAVRILRELDVDCWLTFTRETEICGDPVLPFLVGRPLTWPSALVVCASGRTAAVVGAYDRRTVEETGAWDAVTGYVEGIRQPLLDLLRSLDPRAIAINYSEGSEICDGLTHGMYLQLHRLVSDLGYQDRLISAEGVVSALRQRKTAFELAAIRSAISETEAIFREVAGFIRPGRSERELAAFMQRRASEAGLALAWDPAGCPAVFSGPDTAEAHHAPTERVVERGHVLNMDFGLRCQGYCSDLQRTFYVRDVGEQQAPPEVERAFVTIVRAIESARLALRPGMRGVEIDRIAREALAAAGYEELPHGLGHQVGRFAHDGTALLGPSWEKYAQKPFVPIEAGMVFTLEPRVTVPGRGIVTVEEMVSVAEAGAEFLSTPQRELLLV